ncbi:hypothetical protein DB30_06871 [Enhygromyxa salina]|uniref:Uncharacterized protein n=1 Tax=Enhygromyxa salina TaxID=215803 RepID=A0A0C2CTA2_9BACT|nr:hypothetical protein [Enhygromyxa salina]KIG14396.1 hypothetical protein DB30_06871 [Enhygromyxa salina]
MKEAMNEPMMRSHLRFPTLLSLATGLALTLAACDGPDKQIGQLDGDSGASGESGESGESGDSDESGDWDESGDSSDTSSSDDTGADDSCAPALADLQQKLADEQDNGNSCALVLRFTYESAEFLGWHINCAPPTPDLSLDEAQMMSAWPGDDESGTEDAYVLYTEPGDFGGVTYISKRSGMLFEGSIVWGGMGDILHPEHVEDPLMLGTGCLDTQPPAAVEVWAYNFVGGDLQVLPDESSAVWDVLWDTAALYAVTPGSTIAMIAYPRSVGDFVSDVAEFVVIIDYP